MSKTLLHSDFQQARARLSAVFSSFLSFDLLSNAAKSFVTTRRRRQVSEALQTERERIKFAVPANGS